MEDRAERLALYIIENRTTVRAAAQKFGISKSTVHKDITEKLEKVNPAMFRHVKSILDKNKSERHIRGGMATKEKYMQQYAGDMRRVERAMSREPFVLDEESTFEYLYENRNDAEI